MNKTYILIALTCIIHFSKSILSCQNIKKNLSNSSKPVKLDLVNQSLCFHENKTFNYRDKNLELKFYKIIHHKFSDFFIIDFDLSLLDLNQESLLNLIKLFNNFKKNLPKKVILRGNVLIKKGTNQYKVDKLCLKFDRNKTLNFSNQEIICNEDKLIKKIIGQIKNHKNTLLINNNRKSKKESVSNLRLNAPIPMRNLGATCYINSIMQILCQNNNFIDFLVSKGKAYYKENSIGHTFSQLIENIQKNNYDNEYFCQQIFKELMPIDEEHVNDIKKERDKLLKSTTDSAKITEIKNECNKKIDEQKTCLGRFIHQDAHEFLLKLLDSLSETKSFNTNKKAIINPISKLFEITLNSLINYKLTKNSKIITCERKAFYNMLSLSIVNPSDSMALETLEQCIQSFFVSENIEYIHEDPKIKENVNARKQYSIDKAPQNLIIHLKRFIDTNYKLNNPISIPLELDLAKYMTIKPENNKETYTLNGLVLHTGELRGGHYTSIVKNNNRWWYCSDVKRTELDQGTISDILAAGTYQTFTPYIIFYEKNNPDKVNNFIPSEPKISNIQRQHEPEIQDNHITNNYYKNLAYAIVSISVFFICLKFLNLIFDEIDEENEDLILNEILEVNDEIEQFSKQVKT